jgi:folate-binding protein YgfZ
LDFNDQNYPQEVGLKGLVSFKKGCYLGQEVVCTLENRGKLSRHLCALEAAPGVRLHDIGLGAGNGAAERTPLHGPGAPPPAEPAGFITSAAWDPEAGFCRLLAYVRRAHAVPGTKLLVGAQTLTLVSVVGEADDQRAAT